MDAADVLLKNLGKADAMLLGSGWGMEETTLHFLERLLQRKSSNPKPGMGFVRSEGGKKANEYTLPAVVFDADGLKLLSKIPDWWKLIPPESVLTPHPGEMAVLTGVSTSEIQSSREAVAAKYAKEWDQIVVLKGAFTIIAEPSGKMVTIPVATSALAKAGTGDVLAGMITGLRAQGISAFQAAVAGAWIHAQSGLAAASRLGTEASVLAGDVAAAISDVEASLCAKA